ncbi:MAG: hypothetical protein N2445_07960, partial [Acidobacteria bacterium]|nr:hypothetical protein [Acidobacteriota bacterium]
PLALSQAKNLKRFVLTIKGDLEKAESLIREDSYILDYLLLAPFSNDNKKGFDEVYEPEKNLDFDKIYEGIDKREITFRKLPRRKCFSNIILDDFVDPSQNSTAYLVSFIRSESAQDCVLRVSFSGAFKIFLNGEEVGASKNYNVPTFDQYSFPVRLSAGFNLLMIKTCNSEGTWQFRARITDSKGNPLKNFSATNSIKDVSEKMGSILLKNGRADSKYKFVEPEEILRKRSEKGGIKEKFEYGLYLYGTKPFDKSEHKDLAVFTSILEDKNAPSFINYFAAKCEEDFNRRRDFYEKASEDENYKVESLYELFSYYLDRAMSLKAREYIEKALKVKPQDPVLNIEKQYLYKFSYILGNMAEKEVENIYNQNKNNANILRAVYYLFEDKGVEEKEKILKEYQKVQSDRYIVFKLFELYTLTGRSKEAINTIKEYLSKFQYDRDLIKELCSYQTNLGLCED